MRDRLKEYAEEEFNRIEKERGNKGEWQEGWGMNREMEPEQCETIVEYRRRNARVEEASSSSSRGPTGGWISGGFFEVDDERSRKSGRRRIIDCRGRVDS